MFRSWYKLTYTIGQALCKLSLQILSPCFKIAYMEKLLIKTQDAIHHFGSIAELARFYGVAGPAVSQWGEYLPELRAYQIRDKFPKKFK
jgi:hypothetical protein